MAKPRSNSNGPASTEGILRETAAKVQRMLDTTLGRKPKDAEARIVQVKEVARLSATLGQLANELRQVEKSRRRELAEFSVAEIVAYLRSLPTAKRDAAFAGAFEPDATEPLL